MLATVPTFPLLRSGFTLDCVGYEIDGGFVLLQDGFTALMVASVNGHGEVMQVLLNAGANVEAATNVGGPGACYSPDFPAVSFGSHS